MKTYTDHDINILLQGYNHALPFDVEGGLEQALARAPKTRPRRKTGRVVALLAACAVLLTLTVFAEDIVEIVGRELYRFRTGNMAVSVVSEIENHGDSGRIVESWSLHGSRSLMSEIGPYSSFPDMPPARVVSRVFTDITQLQSLFPFQLPALSVEGVAPRFAYAFEVEPGYAEHCYIEYKGAGLYEYYYVSLKYVGPHAYVSGESIYQHQPIELLGIEGSYYHERFEEIDLHTTRFYFLANNIQLNMSFAVDVEQAVPMAEQILAQVLAIDWEAVKTTLSVGWANKGGQDYLLYQPDYTDTLYADIEHTLDTPGAVQEILPYPMLELAGEALRFAGGTVIEYRPGGYYEGTTLTYDYGDGGRARLWQQYRGPDFTGYSLREAAGGWTIIQMAEAQVMEVDGVQVLWSHTVPGSLTAPDEMDGVIFRFLAGRLEISLTLSASFDEALPLLKQIIRDAQATDWDAVEGQLASRAPISCDSGKRYLLYDPANYRGQVHYEHVRATLEETQALVPYPLIELQAPNADFYRGMVVEYRSGCYYEGATLTYRQKVEGSDIRYYLYQQYRGPGYMGSLLGRDEEGTQPVTVLGIEGLWAPGEPEKHSADPQRVQFRFLVNRLELHIDLPMGFDEALPIVEQALRDAQSIDWDAVESQLAR